MADTDILWPVGTTDRDPDLISRPMVFNPKASWLHIRHYGHRRQSDFCLHRPTS